MKNLTLLSVVTASLLLIGCGQEKSAETKVETTKTEAAAPAHETVAQKAEKAVEATKEAASAAAEKTAQVAKEAKEAVTAKAAEATEAAKEVVTKKAEKAVEATKEAASAVAEKTAKVAEDAKETATKAVEATKEAVAPKTETAAAPAAFGKCAGCHGKNGKMKALGKSEVIAGQSKDDLVKKIGEYKAGTRNVAGMGALMKGQVAGLSDADIDAIATYVSGLK
ncbi:MAG: c-type cytochrome [Epsilonproteobacteria bacterium]|nr:c-type cytochrome [Campylobacterota bacterium]